MDLAISLPQHFADGEFARAPFARYLARAEALGFTGVWAQEQLLGAHPYLSPLETLAYAAACTERIRLGCAVLVTPKHNPVHLAKRLATLDQLSGGRLDVGVGTGGRAADFGAFEVDPATFVARFNEGIAVVRALFSEESVDLDGRFFRLSGASIAPRPRQQPSPPIWFGARHPDAVRRAARLGDAFMGAGSATTEAFASQVLVLRQALEELGRDPAAFPVMKRVYVAVDDDAERAREETSRALAAHYELPVGRDMTPVAVYGPPAACAAGLREVRAAGAAGVLCNPLFDETEQMERIVAEVAPLLD